MTRLRAEVPGIVLRTTFICGFPGSSEADFQELLEFVEEFRFERLGAFPYSKEPNTPAGERFADDVSPEVKAERVERLMALQQPIAFEHASALVGETLDVLVEGHSEAGQPFGRSPYDAPEIDPRVLLEGVASPGSLCQARIVASHGYDLVGQVVED